MVSPVTQRLTYQKLFFAELKFKSAEEAEGHCTVQADLKVKI
jgi:hypothetical protein